MHTTVKIQEGFVENSNEMTKGQTFGGVNCSNTMPLVFVGKWKKCTEQKGKQGCGKEEVLV